MTTHRVIKRSAVVKDVFIAEGVFDLRLGIGELEDLEDLRDVGIAGLLTRLAGGSWRASDIRDTIRIGLIGGGMDAQTAFRIVNSHVTAGSLGHYFDPALDLLKAALYGPEDDPVGEKPGESEAEATAISTPVQSGQSSIILEAPPVGRRKKSAK